ncbi:hypothetical protein ABPG75_004795 [Micractinium tetrahymenae]
MYEQAQAALAAEANTGGIASARQAPAPPAAAAALCTSKRGGDRFYSEPRTCGTCFYRPPPPPPRPPAPPGSRFHFAGYWESWAEPWAASPAASRLAQLPSYVDIVCLAFMWPEAPYRGGLTFEGTGLSFSSEPAVVNGANALLKRRNPRTRVLVSVGGATYASWDRLNATAIANFVREFGLDGVDVDYEGDGSCWRERGKMACTTDRGYTQAVRKLRQALPRPRYLLTTAAWSIGAYGEGRFASSLPQGSHTGMSLNVLRAAGRLLDYVFVMSYDAGDKQSPPGNPTGFNAKEAISAYCTHFPCSRVLAGVQVPPESLGGARISVPEAEDLGGWAARRGAGGLMLWSLTKQGSPSAQQLAQAACRSLNKRGCGVPLSQDGAKPGARRGA